MTTIEAATDEAGTRAPVRVSDEPIHFYFDFVSPFGWIAAERIREAAARLLRSLVWHPILLKATVVDFMGLPPLLDIPLKGAYSLRDAKRCARYYHLTMAADVILTFSPIHALRSVLWCRRHMPQTTGDLVLKLYRHHWSEGGNISDKDTVLGIAAGLSIRRHELEEALSGAALKNELREEVEHATANGVFGSPTMMVGAEPFWGADRLDMMVEWVERSGW